MDWLTNEFIFYGGIGLTLFSLVLGTIFWGIMKFAKVRQDAQLYIEYGERYDGHGNKKKENLRRRKKA